ncbi:MAG: TonB-dependent receptor [Candidatus Delongbacteria bacterium]|nr:TonB-dependent receptor [Candidatus Delongbacteria bacterium]MBN2833482.1 TonB-dependent receptor [Candidatus Delongbacteria bacterium]
MFRQIAIIVFFALDLMGSVKGYVKDENNCPLEGINIMVKSSSIGTASDKDGFFYIMENLKSETLVFTGVGFKTYEVKCSNDENLKIIMHFDDIWLDEVVFTASRSEIFLKDIPKRVDVIPREIIKQNAKHDIAEILDSSPSIEIIKNGYNRGNVSLMGLPSEYTLVLVDGEKIKGGTGTQATDIGQIPSEIVERIEIVKGPASSLYGSDALAGVVNIITRKNKKNPELSFSYGIGSEYTNTFNASTGYTYSDYSAMFTYSKYYTEGYEAPDKYDSDYYFSKFSLFEKIEFSNSFFNSDRNLENMKERIVTSKLSYTDDINTNDQINGSLYYTNYNRKLGSSRNIREADEYSIKSNLQFVDNFWLCSQYIIGLDYYFNNYDTNIITGDEQMISPYLQIDYKEIKDWSFSIGSRVDIHEKWGTIFTPNLSMMYTYDDLKIRSSIGKGFKAPTLSELKTFWFHPNGGGFWIKGNSNLEPEKSIGFNLDLEHVYENSLKTNISFFYNDIDNMIITDVSGGEFDGKDLYTYYNKDEIRSYGAEFSSKVYLNSLINLDFNYTYLKAYDTITENILVTSPKHKASAGISYSNSISDFDYKFGMKSKIVSSQYTDSENLIKVDAYNIEEFSFSLSTPWKLKLNLNIDNIFNREYYIYDKMPERTFLAKFTYEY